MGGFYTGQMTSNIPLSQMVMIYGLGFVLHLICGTCLGVIIAYGQKHPSVLTSDDSLVTKEQRILS